MIIKTLPEILVDLLAPFHLELIETRSRLVCAAWRSCSEMLLSFLIRLPFRHRGVGSR